jgi:FlgD Ig-like domain
VTKAKKNVSKVLSWALRPRQSLLPMFFAFLLCSLITFSTPSDLQAQTTGAPLLMTTFTFTLDEPCKTSAGVYTTNGTLVRTLWSKVRYYAAGTYTTNWNGLDDNGNPVTPGTYQIKLLEHNTEYVWDGAIGNTSAEISGPTVHQQDGFILDMAMAGTNAFYVSGYSEARYDFCNFLTSDPQHVRMKWTWNLVNGQVQSVAANTYDRNWNCTATDGSHVYFACSAATNPTNTTSNNYPGFLIACKVGSNSMAYFTNGIPIVNGSYTNAIYPNGVYVGTQPGLSGLSVQANGNLLAVSVAPDNKVYLLDKLSGEAITNFSVVSPGHLNFSPDGSLWVCSSNSVVLNFTNVAVNPNLARTIYGLSEPLDVAVNPTNANIVLVADGGSSQQIKAFNDSGSALWTYGLSGGYLTNGPAVSTNKFWFSYEGVDQTFLTYAPDGSFWVGDEANHRAMHFDANRNYLEQIMYQPYSYIACTDQNNTSRVFNQFLEFSVDYTKPLSQAWTLVNDWKANADTNHINWAEGIVEITTFTNGRTYGLVQNNAANYLELVELGTNGLRFTGILPMNLCQPCWPCLGADGSARAISINSANFYESTLSGFDASNNPIWNPPTRIASAPDGPTDPVPRCCGFGYERVTISTNNIVMAFDQTLTPGYHLGGIRLGSTNWLWKVSPAANLNGTGTYETSNGVTYAGDTLQAVDRNIIYGYHGEFFRSEGQAGQHMHFYDDGLFVGQFGEASPGHSPYEGALPGFAGNAHCPNLIKTGTGDYYVWDNDENAHGPQRWHLANARNIREQSGFGTSGGTITLTQPVVNFPTGVTGQPGNNSVELSWLPVPGATSYRVYYSLMNGGPYLISAGSIPATNSLIGQLTNGQTYYFAVTAIVGGQEGMPSEQVAETPFDTSQSALCTGSMTEGGQFTPVIDINTNAPANGQPAWIGAEHMTGVLNLRELDDYGYGNLQNEYIGTEGFVLYDWRGFGVNLVDLATNVSVGSGSDFSSTTLSTIFSIVSGTGWGNINYLQRQYRVAGSLGTIDGLLGSPLGSININPVDDNYHYLTVISPSVFNDARNFAMTLTCTNGTTASYTVKENPGLSHVFQFLFKGNVTLTANATGGSDAIIQALFMDKVPVITVTNLLSPPSNLRISPQ